MDAQLHLLTESTEESPAPAIEWRLDDSTRAVGRRGIQRARAALQSATRGRHDEADPGHASAA
jgi:hypothetical protein